MVVKFDHHQFFVVFKKHFVLEVYVRDLVEQTFSSAFFWGLFLHPWGGPNPAGASGHGGITA